MDIIGAKAQTGYILSCAPEADTDRLFNGVVGFRTKPAGVTITDPTSAGKWAREFCPDAIISRLDAKRLAAALMETGEVADFAHFTPAEEVFYVK